MSHFASSYNLLSVGRNAFSRLAVCQSIELLLVSTSWGSVSDEIIVHYTDGSTSSGLVSTDDWRIGPPGVVDLVHDCRPQFTDPLLTCVRFDPARLEPRVQSYLESMDQIWYNRK